MLSLCLRIVIPVVVIVTVSEVSRRSPRLGAMLLTLPVVSILAFVATWLRDQNLPRISSLARETLVLVPLGLPFFVPLAFAERWGLNFWAAMTCGCILSGLAIGLWLTLGPRSF